MWSFVNGTLTNVSLSGGSFESTLSIAFISQVSTEAIFFVDIPASSCKGSATKAEQYLHFRQRYQNYETFLTI